MINLPLLTSKLRPCIIREYRHEDFDACVDLYRAHVPGTLPAQMLPHYEEFLRTGTSYLLVVDENDKITGTGSLTLQGDANGAALAYGIVHPDAQRQGLGSSLLAARLSLVDPETWPARVVLETSPMAGDFFAQFGFQLFRTHKGYEHQQGDDKAPQRLPYGQWHLTLSQEDVEAVRVALAERGVEIHLDNESLFAAEPEGEGEAANP